MPTIKSTYNFVPAPEEKEVLKPSWSQQVSHDIPFSDGESGEIELTITAKTPIFIRNGHAQGQEETEFSHRVVNVNGKEEKEYFIPGTSMKGMVRNVLEIITQSRMKQVNNHRHAVRQIMRTKGTVVEEGYKLAGEEKRNIHAGWLVQKDDAYFIVDCGRPLKIRFTDIDAHYGVSFGRQFGRENLSKMDKDFSARTAKYKYEKLLPNREMEHLFERHPLLEEKQSSWVSKFQTLPYVQFSEDTMDGFMGTIVCVGQASNYSVKTARRGEYVFKGTKEALIESGRNRIQLSPEKMEDFRFINRHNQAEELEDWGYWKHQLEAGIPVFFRKEKDGKAVKDLGLSFMYKQAAEFSVGESYPIVSYSKKTDEDYQPDWAETLFGYTGDKKSLKGRVFFSHLFSENSVNILPERQVVLSNPRSSFFPFYLKQKGNNGRTQVYNTFNHNPVLSGFKRYPVNNKIQKMDTSDMNKEMITAFAPLDEGAIFKGRLRFHNLRKAEIGALISALTFHGKQGDFFHNLGYAKGLGYGKIKIGITLKSTSEKQVDYLKAFEYLVTKQQPDWLQSKAVKELLAMAASPKNEVVPLLEYMDIKDFQEAKNKGQYLQDYSDISATNYDFNGWLNESDKAQFTEVENQIQQEKLAKAAAVRAKIIAEQKAAELAAFNQASQLNTKEALNAFLEQYPDTQHSNAVQQQLDLIRQAAKAEKINLAQADAYETAGDTFDEIKKWPGKKLNAFKDFVFSDAHILDMEVAIEKAFLAEDPESRKSKFYKKKKLIPFSKFPWDDKNIIRWIGRERAQALYKKLTGHEPI